MPLSYKPKNKSNMGDEVDVASYKKLVGKIQPDNSRRVNNSNPSEAAIPVKTAPKYTGKKSKMPMGIKAPTSNAYKKAGSKKKATKKAR